MPQFSKFIVFVIASVALLAASPAQRPNPRPDQGGGPPASRPGDQKPKPPEPPKDRPFDEVIKDYEKIEGQFTLYRKKNQVFMEVMPSQVGPNFLLQATRSTGAGDGVVVAGDPISDTLFHFEKQDDSLYLRSPQFKFRGPHGTPIEKAIGRSFPDAILSSIKIEATHPERKSYLIDVSPMFMGDFAQINASVAGLGPLVPDMQKTRIEKIKNFPTNTVVETAYHFMAGGRGQAPPGSSGFGGGADSLADSRSFPMKVVFNLFKLPDNNYMPRIEDDRVGYFTVDFKDFSDVSKRDMNKSYILRWDMRKKDPKADMSPPAEPIVFWLDNAIPLEYRDAVKNGILWWNKAYEKIGIKDAIVVNQMPDNADWDTADMRYNKILWVESEGSPYAVAQFRNNPITGQILNADITIDGSYVQATLQEFANYVVPNAEQETLPNGYNRCGMGAEKVRQAEFGLLAMDLLAGARKDISHEQFMNAFLSDTIAHEMGHVLGLRHNFIASTELDAKQLADPAVTRERGVVASIMEYDPINVFALKGTGDLYTTTIGPYDYWAIQYGYAPMQNLTPEGELPELKKIASRCNEAGLAYQSDENADRWDPKVRRWDLGLEPMDYYKERAVLGKEMLQSVDQRLPKYGEGYKELAFAYLGITGDYFGSMGAVAREIGGLNANRNHKGDSDEKDPLIPVSAEKQREALKTILDGVFRENSITVRTDLLTKIAPEFPHDIIALIMGASDEFPAKDLLLSPQTSLMRRLFSGPTLKRVLNNEFKTPKDPFTLPEIFDGFDGAVWTEAVAGKNVSMLRRGLQRAYVDMMIDLSNAKSDMPDDAKALAWDDLKKIKSRLTTALANPAKYDTYTRVHFEQALARVTKALDAQFVTGG